MRLEENYDDRFDPFDIQFCLSVQIGNDGYEKIARMLLQYATLMGHGIHGGDVKDPAIVERVRAERDAIEQGINELAEKTGEDLNFAAVRWFCTAPIIKSKKASRSVTHEATSVQVQLGLNENSLQSLYGRVMRMMYEMTRNKLILYYIRSSLFRKPFEIALNIAIRNKFANRQVRNLNAEDYEVLREDFALHYDYTTTPSSDLYHTFTGDPDSSLCGDPLKIYYFNSDNTKIQSVVFGSGQELSTGDDSVSKLNLVELQDTSVKTVLPFADLCSKINRASSLLFSHLNSPVVYDIFSHHCDRLLEPIIKDFRKNGIGTYRGSYFDIKEDSIGCYKNDTHRGKIIERIRYADYLDTRFARRVTINDLAEIQRSILEITETLDCSDGHRLFTTAEHTVSLKFTECERLEILTTGYKAMYELIHYIEAHEGETGISIFDFPTDIFRDSAYLNHFKTFDQYISSHAIIKKLLEELSITRSVADGLCDGFRDGDEVQKILSSRDSIAYSAELQELGKRHISCLSQFANPQKTMSAPEVMATIVDDLATEYYMYGIFSDGYPGIRIKLMGDPQWDGTLFTDQSTTMLCNMFYLRVVSSQYNLIDLIKSVSECGEDPASVYHTKNAYVYSVEYLLILNIICERCGFHFVNESYQSELSFQMLCQVGQTLEGVLKEEMASQSFNEFDAYESAVEMLPRFAVYAMFGIVYCYNVFFGKSEPVMFAQQLTSMDLYKVVYCYNSLRKYLDHSESILAEFSDFVYYTANLLTQNAKRRNYIISNAFQLMLNHVRDINFMSIPPTINNATELACLYTEDDGIILPPDADDATEIPDSSEMLKLLVETMNRMLSAFGDRVSKMNQLSEFFKRKASDSTQDGECELDGEMIALIQADSEILGDSMTNLGEAFAASKALERRNFKYNKYNFIVKNGEIVCNKTDIYDYYYHRLGFVCAKQHGDIGITRRPMTQEDIQFLLSL